MENINLLKAWGLTLSGILGSAIATSLGGWDSALSTLVTLSSVDYFSGLVLAGVFKKSSKTKDGKLESLAGFKGLCKKGMMFLIVLIAYRLDITAGSEFIRDAVIIAYIINESLSIVENAGLMGLPVPAVLAKSIEALKSKNEEAGR